MFKVSEQDDLSSLSYQDLLEATRELQAENATLKHLLFGKKSEQRKSGLGNERGLFNEAELEATVQADEDSLEDPNATNQGESEQPKRKRGGKRKPLSKDLPRRRVVLELDESQKKCPSHGTDLVRIGEKVTEKLEIIPAQVEVVEYVRPTYKCPCCEKDGERSTIVQTPAEPSIIAKSFASASLLAFIIVSKFQDSLPLYRQSAIFSRLGASISRATMSKWVIKVSEQVIPLFNFMLEDSLERKALGCDETPVQILKEEDRKAEQTSYMWVTATMEGPPIVLFEYNIGRSAKAAAKILAGYSGTLVCDGLKSYDSFAKNAEDITLAGCMAHIRRKFYTAEKALKKAAPKQPNKASYALDLIKNLYQIEKKIQNQPMQQRLEVRQLESKKIMNELETWLYDQKNKVLPKSLLGRAVSYATGQWPKMQVFLGNPLVEIDNNRCERHIKQFVIGRKNWMFAATPDGANASARLYSLVETAKANGLDPYDYLHRVFKELPKVVDTVGYERLLPYNIHNHFNIKPYSKPN